MTRIVGRQIYKSNVKAATPEEYYLKNLAILFLDNVNMEIFSIVNKMYEAVCFGAINFMSKEHEGF